MQRHGPVAARIQRHHADGVSLRAVSAAVSTTVSRSVRTRTYRPHHNRSGPSRCANTWTGLDPDPLEARRWT